MGLKQYSNAQLWGLAETKKIENGDVFQDKRGNQIVFTGKLFKAYYPSDLCKVMYLNDSWEYIGRIGGVIW